MVTQSEIIHIDGSQGEGGGQILRSALALSMVTGRAFVLSKVRAGREKPGLMRQHLTCVQAAAAISGASVSGAELRSSQVSFTPRVVRAGTYHFPIGTAGSTTMVLQAVLPALLRGPGPSTVVVEGGTHNKAAPPWEFFERSLVPLLNRMGAGVTARLERHGFYPAGGGRVVVEVAPASAVRVLDLPAKGGGVTLSGLAIVSRVPRSVAERELAVLAERLGVPAERLSVRHVDDAPGAGNVVIVEAQSAEVTQVVSALGEIGRPAERVAADAARQVEVYVATGVPVGEHLADQLMVPLAVMAGGSFYTGGLSGHATTNAAVIRAFGVRVDVEADGRVVVGAISPER